MAIVFPGQQDPYGIQAIGNPLIQALQQRTQANRQQQQGIREGGILDSVISGLGQEPDAMAVVRAIAQAKGQGVSNESLKQFEPYFKQIGEQQQQKQLAGQKQQMQQQELEQKRQEKIAPAELALKTIARQRELLKSGHLGPKVGLAAKGRNWGSTFSKEGQKARAEYEQAGKSLISLASNMKITNRNEFDALAHKLFDPTLGQNEIEGILDSMEQRIKESIGQEGYAPQEAAKTSERQQSETIKFRNKKTGKTGTIPRNLWESEKTREGYEEI